MVNSMTGFGKGNLEENGRRFNVEIKSVNNRYLDLNIKLPRQLNELEDRVRKYIASRISRGKIDIYINQEKFNEEDINANVDEKVADAYYNAFVTLKEKFKLKDDITLSLLSRMPDVINVDKREDDIDEVWETLSKALDMAINMLVDMRLKEGLKLSKDIILRCDVILTKVLEIEKRSPEMVDEFREKILNRVKDYLKEVEVDEARLLNEVAFFSDKCNITEEIVRLKSHIEQFKNTFNLNEPTGRKLDFLIQEMNREINTIGSKSNDLTITNLVVEVKSELEKIREQIQNIE